MMRQPRKRVAAYYMDLRPPGTGSGAFKGWVIRARTIKRRVAVIAQKLEAAKNENTARLEKVGSIVVELPAMIPKRIEIMKHAIRGICADEGVGVTRGKRCVLRGNADSYAFNTALERVGSSRV